MLTQVNLLHEKCCGIEAANVTSEYHKMAAQLIVAMTTALMRNSRIGWCVASFLHNWV